MLSTDKAISDKLLGDFEIASDPLPGVEEGLKGLENAIKLGAVLRTRKVEKALLEWIQKGPSEAFFLPALLDLIATCKEKGLLCDSYTFNHFELFLNQHSGLSEEENRQVRGKIVGKFLPREEYQAFFPIGGGRVHPGSHYVTAHAPPDIDTSVASFWGWVDAFGAKVSTHLHIWNLPGGMPAPAIQRVFAPFFGKSLFEILPRSSQTLDIAAIDLAGQSGLELRKGEVMTTDLNHQRTKRLIALVDQEGFYLGSWRTSDVEGFRLIAILINQIFQWLSSTLTSGLASLFAQPTVKQSDLTTFLQALFDMKIAGATPLRGLAEGQKVLLERTLQGVCHLPKGLDASVRELIFSFEGMHAAADLIFSLESALFDSSETLIEDRPLLFAEIKQVIEGLAKGLDEVFTSFDRLSSAIEVKHGVYGEALQYVPPKATFEEIVATIGDHHFLMVAELGEGERLIPVGVVEASDLQRKVLGTVSLRDFCNRDEVKIPEHLEIISVVDHHRTSLHTHSFPTAILGDAGACNVLLAEQAFAINDCYGSLLKSFPVEGEGPAVMRGKKRMLTREIAQASRGCYYVHPKREFAEYLSFLYAILDDTDLLDRVTARDVGCVAQLLNRLKSLMLGRDIEVIHFDDLERGSDFPKQAAKRLLQNEDLYSLYLKVFERRKEELERDLMLCAQGQPSDIFSDTKEQKGGARVGQTKIFADSYSAYEKHASEIRNIWIEKAERIYQDEFRLDLHIQMVSTMAGAKEVYEGKKGIYSHQDELWIWVPPTEEGRVKLATYLNLFKKAPELAGEGLEIEIIGDLKKGLDQLFSYHFRGKTLIRSTGNRPMAILRYPAGTITSRKASITPYLPG